MTCRCGAHNELPRSSLHLFLDETSDYTHLCRSCTIEILKFIYDKEHVMNFSRQPAEPTDFDERAAELRAELEAEDEAFADADDFNWDDLTQPWVDDDLPYELHKGA